MFSLRVLELLLYPIRSLKRCTRSATSAFCRHRLSLQMPRRSLSGPKNIVLLLSTPYVANWLRRTSATPSRRFVRSVQRLQPGLDLCATRLHKNGRFGRHPSPSCTNTFANSFRVNKRRRGRNANRWVYHYYRTTASGFLVSPKACSRRSAAAESPFFFAIAFWIERELSL
jgi:hypothetical protein